MIYPFSVIQTEVEHHVFWIAKSNSLKGCVGQGETMDEAMKELEANEQEWIETAREVGIPIPEIPIEKLQEYSGKLTLRVSPAVHRKAALLAKKEGISLNQYLNDAIVAQNSERSTVNYVSQGVTNMLDQLKRRFLKYTPGSTSEAVIDCSFPTARPSFYRTTTTS